MKMSSPWRCLLAAMMVAISLSLVSAQNEDDVTTTSEYMFLWYVECSVCMHCIVVLLCVYIPVLCALLSV